MSRPLKECAVFNRRDRGEGAEIRRGRFAFLSALCVYSALSALKRLLFLIAETAEKAQRSAEGICISQRSLRVLSALSAKKVVVFNRRDRGEAAENRRGIGLYFSALSACISQRSLRLNADYVVFDPENYREREKRPQHYSALNHCKAIAALAFLFCVVSSQARAQDFRQMLLDMRDGYGRLEKFHAVMTIQVFEDEKSKAPFYKEQAEVKKDSQDYFYAFDDTEMLLNNSYMIAVNHSLKQIIWSPRDVKAQQAFMTPLPLNIDSILTFYEAPVYKGNENGTDHYIVKQKGSAIRQIDMYLDVQTHFIRKLEYRYTDGQYMITTFEKFETQPVFNDKTFSESRYWSKDGGGQRANATFAGYTITKAPQNN